MVTLSVIIPTLNEGANLFPLVRRIDASLKNIACDYELWFIDDSNDDTPDILAELQKKNCHIHFIHRNLKQGLGSAILEGFRQSHGIFLIVMDGDLQHPPEYLPVILSALKQGNEIVIPSRFLPGGSDGGLNVFRKSLSWTARVLSQRLVKQFRCVSDCTSGYFGLHRDVIENIPLQPGSWKILMEILVKGRYQTLHEIPYPFAARDAGESKMSFHEQWKFLKHLLILARQRQ